MRIRFIREINVTVVSTNTDSGKMSVEESIRSFSLGRIVGGFFDVTRKGDTVDLHHVNGDIYMDIPKDAVEIHGDKPTHPSYSKNCCKARK